MKISFFAWLIGTVLIYIQYSAMSQKAGIYLTSSDFDAGKTSFVKEKNLKYKLRVNNICNPSALKVSTGGSIYHFHKDSIFGYRDNENMDYRFYDNKAFHIINPNETILIYKHTMVTNSKGNQTLTEYFFSSNSKSIITPLTKLNLKEAFSNNASFHELIDMYFESDTDLISYDAFYHIFKINRIHQLK